MKIKCVNPDLVKKHILKVPIVMCLTTVIVIATQSQLSAFDVRQKITAVNEKMMTWDYFLDEEVIRFLVAIDVQGRVVDENNQPLSGATVKVKGTNIATITNIKGEFVLKNVDEKAVLIVSFLGYESQEIIASDRLDDIRLTKRIDKLKEVNINTGYYTVREREITGSISKISANIIAKQPVNNPIMALQNRVPGVEIIQSTGVPGGEVTVRIRGQNSISRGNDPLYIINGVQYPSVRINNYNSTSILNNASPLSLISPGDIESIEILKDADATAIYGSRGANGVILITTKQGSIEELKINADIALGFSRVGNRLELMNTDQYFAMRMEGFKNDGLSPGPNDYDVNGTWDRNRYTNWQDKLIGGTANITNSSISVSGGSKHSNYLVGGNFYKEGTVFPGSFGFKRTGINTAINFGSIETKLSATFNGTYTKTINNLLRFDPTANIAYAPNAPDPYDQYGKLNWDGNNTSLFFNPMAELLNTIDASTDNLIGNAILSYRIFKNLTLKTSLGYTAIKREENAKSPLASKSPANNPTSINRSSRYGNTYNHSWVTEPQLTYDVNIGLSKFSTLLGMTFQQNSSGLRNITASNFNSDELMDNISSASVFSVTESENTEYKYAALFGRINYSLANRYYINLTGRRDASSRFGPNNQFANFGAVGAAWVFSEESGIKKMIPFLSFGKLRVSYGLTGNDQLLDYRYLQLYNSGSPYQNTPTLTTTRIGNNDYGWETNKKAEAGLQLGLFNDKLNIHLVYFLNRSSNQLVSLPLPPSVGFNNVQANLPAKVENTGLEVESAINIFKNKRWDWSISLNMNFPKNKLIDFPGLSTSNYSSTFIIGQPLNIHKYLNTNVDQQTGLYIFEDKDKDGVESTADKYLHKFIGQTFYGGVENSIGYKRFNFDFFISFTKQTGYSSLSMLSYPPVFFDYTLPLSNQTIEVLKRWQNPNDLSEILKFSTTTESYINSFVGLLNGRQSISDNSFMRLKNISLGYTVPGHWLSKFHLKSLNVYFQGQNLFTLTKYAGLDPENLSSRRLPPLRTFSFGFKIIM